MQTPPPYALVADPHRPTATAIAAAVTAVTGLPCELAGDGDEGHAHLARRGIPAAMVTDLVLPKRDGFALIRGLRRLDRERRVPVVAYTSFPAMRKSAQSLHAELFPLTVISKAAPPYEVAEALVASGTLAGAPLQTPPVPAPAGLAAPPRPGRSTAPAAPARNPGSVPPGRSAPPPADSDGLRLARIESMGVVDDAPPDADLQRITEDVARSFGVPTALVTVVLEGKQWFKSYYGITGKLLEDRGSPRSMAFCHHVVEGRAALVVPDARTHPLFADNPLVLDGTIGSYAGAPLVTPHGDVLGSLCIIDRGPLEVGNADLERLRLLARRVSGELELASGRRRQARLAEALRVDGPSPAREVRAPALAALESAIMAIPCATLLLDHTRRALFANHAFLRRFQIRGIELTGVRREVLLSRLAQGFADPEDALSRLAAPPDGPFAMSEEIRLSGPRGGAVRWSTAPIALPGGEVQIVTVTDV